MERVARPSVGVCAQMEGGGRLEELREGDTVQTKGDGKCIEKQQPPPWVDKEKFDLARDVYRRHIASSINFSHLCGLLLSFYFTKNLTTLRSTGASESTTSLFHRYLATIRHIQKWYEGDVWDSQDPAHKSVANVRTMHHRVAVKMAARKDGVVYVSQWDMALTQWAFIGPLVLFPTKVGLHGCNQKELEALVHFWRGIGFLLGIKDRYNLCHGSYRDAVAACRDMLHKEYQPHVSSADPESESMARKVLLALRRIDKLFTWGCLATYIHELVDVPCSVPVNIVDRICYLMINFVMSFAIRYTLVRLFMNHLFRWRLDMAERHEVRDQQMKSELFVAKVSAC